MSFKEELQKKTELTEEIIRKFLPKEEGFAENMAKAMNYSMCAGGKRIRPMLLMETCRMFGGDLRLAEPFIAALTAVNIYNIAGQRAEKACEGPGSFQVHFLDELYRSTPDDVAGSLFDMA